MSLYRRKGSANWYSRLGRDHDRSTGTPDRAEAEAIHAKWKLERRADRSRVKLAGIAQADERAMREYMRGVLRKCRQRNPYTLSADVEEDLTRTALSGRCEITGLPFTLHKPEGYRRRPYAPSVDRIDASKPYQDDNVRVVCVCVNYALNEWGEKVLRQMALGYLQTHFIPWVQDLESTDR